MNRLRFYELRNSAHAVFLVLALTVAMSVNADDSIRLHGAISQGLITTDNNNFNGPSDDGVTLKLTEISLNLSKNLRPDLRAAAQLLYRRAGEHGDDAEVDYAILDYQFLTNLETTAGIRLGRFKNPFGIYNATRDIAFTRPTMFLPQSIYPDQARQIMLSTDGLIAFGQWFQENGKWSIDIGGGKPRVDDVRELLTAFESSQTDDEKLVIAKLGYQHNGGEWLVSLSALKVDLSINASDFGDGDLGLRAAALSSQYNWESWTLTSEYMLTNMKADFPFIRIASAITGKDVDFDVDGESFYLQLDRRLGRKLTLSMRWDKRFSDENGGVIQEMSTRFGLEAPIFGQYNKDVTLGIRWDPNINTMLRVEYHHVSGTSWLDVTQDNEKDELSKNWNMLAAEIAFRF